MKVQEKRLESLKKRTKMCPNCNNVFVARIAYPKQRFCTALCATRFLSEQKYFVRECPICGKSFKTTESKNQQVCSQKCTGKFQRREIEVSCHKCGKEYFVRPSGLKKKNHVKFHLTETRKTFCSKECYISWQKESRRTQLDSPKKRLFRKAIAAIKNAIFRGKEHRDFRAIFGFTPDELRRHLEKNFKPGMTWDNYGEWHIDHIIPLSKLNYSCVTDPDFRRAWSLKNLQPLWAQENFHKTDKLDAPLQPSLSFGEAA